MKQDIDTEKKEREGTEEMLLNLLEDTCTKLNSAARTWFSLKIYFQYVKKMEKYLPTSNNMERIARLTDRLSGIHSNIESEK